MKTLEDLYKEVMASEELKKAFAQAAKDKKVADFLKAQGCDASEDEFKAFLTEKAKTDKALSEEDLENVAGGVYEIVDPTKRPTQIIDESGDCRMYKE